MCVRKSVYVRKRKCMGETESVSKRDGVKEKKSGCVRVREHLCEREIEWGYYLGK